jgi:signal transduction histidine kinase
MRWPIRNQILLPFAVIVLVAVAALTILAAMLAARRSERQTFVQLQNTIDTLLHANFPFTAPVLQKMRGLSGAHFIGFDANGGVVASTLPAQSDLPGQTFPESVRGGLSSLAAQPTVEIGGAPYFAARLLPRGDTQVRSLVVLYPVDRLSRDRRDAALLPLMVGGPALLLTSLVALWLAQRFSRRLRRLEAQVSAIAAGDFCEIPPGRRQDEIEELVAAVNRMAAQLRQMRNTIRQTEQTRLLAQLAGGLAHHLRNAVAGARLALQLHQRRCVAAPADRSLDVALRQLSLTETQVRGLLSLGRGERRPATICDLRRLAAEVRTLLEPSCDHARVALEFGTEDTGELLVSVDVEELRAVLLNLALNGIEAAGAGGGLRVLIGRDGGKIWIDVCDSGSGPPQEVAGSLFEAFVTTKPEGVGLGLALARQVASAQGGTLEWFRRADWTVFRLALPSARQESASELPVEMADGASPSRILESEPASLS